MRILGLLIPVIAMGCGGKSRPQEEVDRGRAAVVAALENWKSNEPAAKLKSLAVPIEFNEELRNLNSLTEYSILKVDSSDANVIRVTVSLKLKEKKGKTSEREAVYSVALKSPIAVTRDPYF